MNTTWGEIKKSVYALMFLNEAQIREYSSALPEAANYAFCDIASSLCPIQGEIVIGHYPPENLLLCREGKLEHGGQELTLSANGVKAIYFECNGNGTATVEDEQGSVYESIELSSQGAYKSYRCLISIEGKCVLRFSTSYAFRVRNAAMYSCVAAGDAESIPPSGKYSRYDIKKLSAEGGGAGEESFMGFMKEMPVVKIEEGAFGTQRVMSDDFIIEQDRYLLLPEEKRGDYEVRFMKYPKKITSSTPDDYEPDIPRACALIAPLVIAWRLYKEDDERISAMYYNEYLKAKEQLRESRIGLSPGGVSVSVQRDYYGV